MKRIPVLMLFLPSGFTRTAASGCTRIGTTSTVPAGKAIVTLQKA